MFTVITVMFNCIDAGGPIATQCAKRHFELLYVHVNILVLQLKYLGFTVK